MAPTYHPRIGHLVNASALELAIREARLQDLNPESLARFESYLALLLRWNPRLNLTAIREPGTIIRRHFVEGIQCAQALPVLPRGAALLDFGSGAGLPGIPIAICRPEIRVTLAESQRKKAAFLQEAVRSLVLQAEVFDGRVEEMPAQRQFSFVTLRAVDRMAEACRTAVARIAPQGWIAVFATKSTEPGLKALLPEIRWLDPLPIYGLKDGTILLGQRGN
jgi:16S rRNA (guanine527-N7)-methyltransferase